MTRATAAAAAAEPENYFAELARIDVSDHVEKKGKFSYLSWAWAVDQLRRNDPEASWEVIRFDGKPFMHTECGYFVEVAVTCKGVTLSQIHPVLDNNNRPIPQPNSFQINTSIQRCLVKAIALHGLGLYIYAGEDLPVISGEEQGETAAVKEDENPSARLKAKYEMGTGRTDGFEAWVDKMKAKGMTFPQMDYILQEALNKKTEESKAAESKPGKSKVS